MISRRELRGAVALVLAAMLASSPARALVTLNDGRDRIHVQGTVSVGWDSNIFANSDDKGDFVYSTTLTADYTRRAGWIGVNANASISSSFFGKFSEEDFANPNFGMEFTKQTGRTTGSLTLGASRQSRADASTNTRSDSWNYSAGLNFKYPIVSAYTMSGQVGYAAREFVDETTFASLETYNASLDLLRILSSEREMVVGYRYRFSETSRSTQSVDHGVSLGLSGKLIRGVIGSARIGYMTRKPKGAGAAGSYDSWTASVTSTYAFNKKLNFTGTLSKDFSTTATDSSVDVINASLDATYAYSSRWSLSANAGWGYSQFLGEGGRVVLVGPQPAVFDPDGTLITPAVPAVLGVNREDNYFNWGASISYSMSEHLKLSLAYSYFKNWSTLSYADFERGSWSFTATSRW